LNEISFQIEHQIKHLYLNYIPIITVAVNVFIVKLEGKHLRKHSNTFVLCVQSLKNIIQGKWTLITLPFDFGTDLSHSTMRRRTLSYKQSNSSSGNPSSSLHNCL
jgi:hypothetical protein